MSIFDSVFLGPISIGLRMTAIFVLGLPILSCAPLMIGPAYFPVTESRAALNAKGVAVDSYKKFAYQEMAIGKVIKTRIDRQDAVYEFKDGKSFYEAYVLSDAISSITLDVKSWQDRHGKWNIDDHFYIYPEFIFLDVNKEEIGSTNGTQYVPESDLIKGYYLSIKKGIVFARPAKYFILKASTQHFAHSVHRTAVVGGSQYSPPDAVAVTVPFNYEGTVEFSLAHNASRQGVELAPVVDKKAMAANREKLPLSAEQGATIKACGAGLTEKDIKPVMATAQTLRAEGYEKEALTCFIALNKLPNIEPDIRKELNTIIGIMYEMGEGVPASLEEAKKYYKAAGLD
ncbi:MAG TPA: SEL1-like repeat protein [Cellvibrionaceae bacterium]|nr:SEL1-like repeat protein [Cellvibrionaceae bacterium]